MTSTSGAARTSAPANGSTPAFVLVTALAVVGVQLATGWRYGLFRDELYYLACASHLDWGYVDHPPLSIIVLAGVRGVLGDGLLPLRLVPALLFGLLVWLAARLAREFGGGRFAQSLAALAVAVAPEYLALTGFYSMNASDLVFWAAAALLVARLARTDEVRLWRPLGVVIGLGLLNKISLLFFAFGLAVAVLVTPLRRHLARRELWEGVVLALVLFSPYVLWQLRHDWATLEFMRNASRYKNVALSPLSFFTAQILDLHPFNAPLWLMGLGWLLFGSRGRRFRALAIVFIVTFVTESLISEGSFIEKAHIERSVIGIRTRVADGAHIRHSLILGADVYESAQEIERSEREGTPPIVIGSGSVIENAIVDKNARVGRGVRILNEKEERERDGATYYIRDGIVVIPKNAVIPDGTVI